MGRVLAVGVFDILDPGHLAYLNASADLDEELVVLVVRDSAISGSCLVSEMNRVKVVGAVSSVDRVLLQPTDGIIDTVRSVQPTTIALAPRYSVEPATLTDQLANVDLSVTVTRVQYDRDPLITRVHQDTEPLAIDAIFGDNS